MLPSCTQEENTSLMPKNISPKTIYWFFALGGAFSREKSRKLRVLVSFFGCVFGPSNVCAFGKRSARKARSTLQLLKWPPWSMWIARHPIFPEFFFPSGVPCANFPSRKSWRELCALKPWRGREKGTAMCLANTIFPLRDLRATKSVFAVNIFPHFSRWEFN